MRQTKVKPESTSVKDNPWAGYMTEDTRKRLAEGIKGLIAAYKKIGDELEKILISRDNKSRSKGADPKS